MEYLIPHAEREINEIAVGQCEKKFIATTCL